MYHLPSILRREELMRAGGGEEGGQSEHTQLWLCRPNFFRHPRVPHAPPPLPTPPARAPLPCAPTRSTPTPTARTVARHAPSKFSPTQPTFGSFFFPPPILLPPSTEQSFPMPREIVHPAPFWARGVFHSEWSHVRAGLYNRRAAILAAASLYAGVFALGAYADRRCLYVYQKHDPRTVELPWEQDFRAKYMSHH